MTFSHRIYIYGVNYDGSREFLTTDLNKQGARSYCAKFTRIFPHRFERMIFGTIKEIQEGSYEVFQEG